MKIAIFQANTVDNQADSNLKRYDSFLENLDKDTELLVFPEMFTTGFMANYMRMYWAKKIMEWMPSMKEAYQTIIYLNNKFIINYLNYSFLDIF